MPRGLLWSNTITNPYAALQTSPSVEKMVADTLQNVSDLHTNGNSSDVLVVPCKPLANKKSSKTKYTYQYSSLISTLYIVQFLNLG